MGILKNYAWPGNIRELENVIAQSMILADGNTLQPTNLPPNIAGEFSSISLDSSDSHDTKSKMDSVESRNDS